VTWLPPFPASLERWSRLAADVVVVACILAGFYCVASTARYWMGEATPVTVISLAPSALPAYAVYSLIRIAVAYFLSLALAVGYAYAAAHMPRVESFLIAVLDILQSIPVLSFLPGVMLTMIALFPTRQIGVELGAILLILTGQIWNMAFSFYSSLKSIPRELREAAIIYRYSRWQRFFELELPYGTIGLVWNSMVSVAGGWFFLMACEMFVLGKRDFRLPGLGSYLQTAASAGDTGAILWGVATMIGLVILIDQLVWRPLIAWSDKFKFETVESAPPPQSPVLQLIRNSRTLRRFRKRALRPLGERLASHFARNAEQSGREPIPGAGRWIGAAIVVIAIPVVLYAATRALLLLHGTTRDELVLILRGATATFLRVWAALLIGALWAIPAGVAIGSNRSLARFAQPAAQILASVPATALFPVVLLALIQLGGGLGIASILLMLLGTQWYILFNVIAGTTAIPSDLREAARIFRFSRAERWRIMLLPGIFPYLVTGLTTASGGAWNASIVAEYFNFKGKTLSTLGLGSQISSATDAGQFNVLLLCTVVMAFVVVCINRLLWRPLYRRAETRYRLSA
jgi:NitT/TauT family transport system permease protein